MRVDKTHFWYKWYSICSRHDDYDKTCNMCQAGRWINIPRQFFDNIVYWEFPNIWKWYVNRRRK